MKNFMLPKWSLVWLLAVGVVVVIGCDDDAQSSIRVELYAPENQPQALTEEGGLADELELVFVNTDDPFADPKISRFDVAGRSGRVSDLPSGGRYQLFVRGFNQLSGDAVLYGASAVFDATGDDLAVSVQVGQANCVGLNRGSALAADPSGTPDMVSKRVGMTATLLLDGRVLVVGGALVDPQGEPREVLNTAEIYDPKSGTYAPLDHRLGTGRVFHTATLLASGDVLFVGGLSEVGAGRAVAEVVEIFTPGVGFRAMAGGLSQGQARYGHQAVRLGDDRATVLLTGGLAADGQRYRSTFRYFPSETADPTQGAFLRQGDLRDAREGHAMAAIDRGLAFAIVAGGLGDDGVLGSVETFTTNPTQVGCNNEQAPSADVGCFVNANGAAGAFSMPRFGHTAVSIDGGRKVLFVGGYTRADRGAFANDLEVLDENLKIVSGGDVGQLSHGRGDLSATLLPDGSVVVVGGRRGTAPEAYVSRLVPSDVGLGFQEAELSLDCELSEPRYGHVAVTTAQGTVLVVGGATWGAFSGDQHTISGTRRGELYFPQVLNLEDVYPR